MMGTNSQRLFETVYRGRQSAIYHLSYLRTSKVLLLLDTLETLGITLHEKRVFDYGFGAGTLFRYCPKDAILFGVELDQVNVDATVVMLTELGHRTPDLQTIQPGDIDEHRLMKQRYDVIVCSHVLEHLNDPDAFLKRLTQCLDTDGIFVGIVPINEIRDNPHHIQKVDRALVERWAAESGLHLLQYSEADEVFYPVQPLFVSDKGWRHVVAQGISLGFGLAAAVVGPRLWWNASKMIGAAARWKPAQAIFVATANQRYSRGSLSGSDGSRNEMPWK
jgi:SAM-dependent methyltransferase